ncbi:pentatricopeptide repeat-containing protein [Corchorus olitorius]|uniref:Pentatricopeptide repeat-containing protein n=1 Tax=Corchorus olitorius TaxID=93759 RepID=A0A1R3KKI9_9ROSI|nr:pentatricopeptide repeat-containing protein [Corchorus olitorius]
MKLTITININSFLFFLAIKLPAPSLLSPTNHQKFPHHSHHLESPQRKYFRSSLKPKFHQKTRLDLPNPDLALVSQEPTSKPSKYVQTDPSLHRPDPRIRPFDEAYFQISSSFPSVLPSDRRIFESDFLNYLIPNSYVPNS